jgi:hypothetical protein
MYKVTKGVDTVEIEIANNGYIMRYSGRDAADDWVADKIVMPDLRTVMTELERLTNLK